MNTNRNKITYYHEKIMTIKIDSDLELKQLQLSDSRDIFNTIDSQRAYLGKWLPFVELASKVRKWAITAS